MGELVFLKIKAKLNEAISLPNNEIRLMRALQGLTAEDRHALEQDFGFVVNENGIEEDPSGRQPSVAGQHDDILRKLAYPSSRKTSAQMSAQTSSSPSSSMSTSDGETSASRNTVSASPLRLVSFTKKD